MEEPEVFPGRSVLGDKRLVRRCTLRLQGRRLIDLSAGRFTLLMSSSSRCIHVTGLTTAASGEGPSAKRRC